MKSKIWQKIYIGAGSGSVFAWRKNVSVFECGPAVVDYLQENLLYRWRSSSGKHSRYRKAHRLFSFYYFTCNQWTSICRWGKRKEILAVMKEVDYIPNANARQLSYGKRKALSDSALYQSSVFWSVDQWDHWSSVWLWLQSDTFTDGLS